MGTVLSILGRCFFPGSPVSSTTFDNITLAFVPSRTQIYEGGPKSSVTLTVLPQ